MISLLITNNLDSMSKEIADRHNIETIYVNNDIMSSWTLDVAVAVNAIKGKSGSNNFKSLKSL